MDYKYRKALFKHKQKILDLVVATDVLPYMRYNEHFDLDEEQKICYSEDENLRARYLFNVLMRKPNETIDIFVDALIQTRRACYDGLLAELQADLSRPMDEIEVNEMLISGRVPLRPSYYVSREEIELQIRTSIETLVHSPAWVIIWGIGGVGKSTLCAEALRDKDILDLFPNGLEWFHAGKFESADQRFSKIGSFLEQLDPDGKVEPPTSIAQAQKELVRILKSRPGILLVLDDVWDSDIVQIFDVYARVLVSTRDLTYFDRVQGEKREIHVREGLAEEESALLLSKRTGIAVSELPPQASLLIKKSGGLPLALAIIGAYLKQFPNRWDHCTMKSLELRSKSTYEHSTVKEAMLIGIEALGENLKLKYINLVVFPIGTLFSPEIVSLLWVVETEVAEEILDDLMHKSLLIEENDASLDSKRYLLHDIQKDVLEEIVTDKKSLHIHFAEICSKNWSRLELRDDYILRYVAYHLSQARMEKEFIAMYSNPQFLSAAICKVGPFNVLADMMTYASEAMRSDVNWLTALSVLEENVSDLSEIGHTDRKEQQEHILEAVIQSGLCCGRQTLIYEKSFELAQVKPDRYWLLLNPTKMKSFRPLWKVQVTNVCYNIQIIKQEQLAVAGCKGDITILDCSSGKIISNWNESIRESGHSVYCCVSENGEMLAAETALKTVRLFKFTDVGSKMKLAEESNFVADAVVDCLLFEKDDMHILCGLDNGVVMRYPVQPAPPTEVARFDGAIQSLAISADGSQLAVGVLGKSYYIHRFENGQSDKMHVSDSIVTRRKISFARFEGVEVIVFVWSKSIRIWNPITNAEVSKSFCLPNYVECVAVGSNRDIIAGGDENGIIKVWEYSTEIVLRVIDSAQRQTALAFYNPFVSRASSTAEISLISGSLDGVITRWSIDTQDVHPIIEHEPDTRQCQSVFAAYANNPDQLIIVTQDMLKDIEFIGVSREGLHTTKDSADSTVWSIAISLDGSHAAVGLEDGTIQIYSISICATGPLVIKRLLKKKTHAAAVSCLIFLTNNHIVSTDNGGGLQVFDIKLKTAIKEGTAHARPDGPIAFRTTVRFLSHRKSLLSAGNDLHIRMWDFADESGEAAMDVDTQHDFRQLNFFVDQDEQFMITFTWESKIAKVWSLPLGKLLYTLEHEHELYSCSICSRDSTLVATGDGAGTVRLYRIDEKSKTVCALEPFMKFSTGSKYITALSWNTSRDTLVVGNDNRLYAWKYTINSSTTPPMSFEPFPLQFVRLGAWENIFVCDDWIVSKTSQGTLHILRQLNRAVSTDAQDRGASYLVHGTHTNKEKASNDAQGSTQVKKVASKHRKPCNVS